MVEILKAALLTVSALFPIVNPLGGSPIFLSLTAGYTTVQRQILSWKIAVNSFFLLIGAHLVGTHILAFFGISLPVVQVGGGLVVMSTGWAMLNQKDDSNSDEMRKNVQPQDPSREAFYPLTLPLTVGPGSISIAITLGANASHASTAALLSIIGAIIGSAILGLSVYLCYGFADRLARILGPTAMSVIMRLSSFLLMCIGVQILWNGIKALLGAVQFRM